MKGTSDMTTTANFHPACRVEDDATRSAHQIVREDWHECATCGEYVHNNDTVTKCNPAKIRQYAKYLAAAKKRQIIQNRMDERQRKYEAAQAKDRLAIYELEKVW